MGNCLNCVGGGQQDSANLLGSANSSSDPALAIGTSQEISRPSLAYGEIVSSYYPSVFISERHMQSTEMEVSRGIGIGVNVIQDGGQVISDEEHQVRMAKRIGLIQHLPMRKFDGAKKGECVICMMELMVGEEVRYLPCMHTYHAMCIDDWLLRSLTCPTCMEPVDAALINSYHPTS
ncbi:hypothetical protein QAD02_007090 [Eretmocerus hayati]|uniref:Uncharacterized protein n=1 Tax=Eretmocerus hayati TaxID=131215 RepID=A0ACC2N375_9HYME|nr:hypothetical protein QAD02_007090 [Eretmocerus hayati]